ncbi:MAG: PilZ domain-containing protein [Thermodesulfobacteriota bacterium]
MAQLRPGMAISLVVNSNAIREINDIRSSTVYDQEGKKLIIAQTEPMMLSDYEGKPVTVSFLTQEKGNPVRYGFQAKVIKLLRDYSLNPSQQVPAIALVQRSLTEQYNLRMFYRIQPPSDFGLWLSVFDQPVNIIDISIGGAIVSASSDLANRFKFEIEGLLNITLIIDDEHFNLQAKIKRLPLPDYHRGGGAIQMVAMEFCDRTPELDRTLGEKILNIQRQLRSKGLEI